MRGNKLSEILLFRRGIALFKVLLMHDKEERKCEHIF